MSGTSNWFIVMLLQIFNLSEIFAGSGILISSRSNIKVYWNIPTFQCRSFKMNFTEIAERYGIIQNDNDDFRGSRISILYDPGYFPAIMNESGKMSLRNGGIPQSGNLETHLKIFQENITNLIPDEAFSGLGIIDFENWRPIYRQNFGTLVPYKTLSIQREKFLHPFWPASFIEAEAQKKFEFYGRIFMDQTLALAKKLRPKAKWGYYAYPYCFNKSPKNTAKDCPKEVLDENDRLHWLFRETDLLVPSLYLNEKMSRKDKLEEIEGRINEAARIIRKKQQIASITPYFWYKYQDTRKFLTKEDLKHSFSLLSNLRINGLIIWGSSNDVNSKAKCINMYNYLNDILGPILTNTL
ncbi:hypothetical protein WA026_002695 [Henosepilachna vigintioctopunctata]|uniref:Hyaluronidase n=1 Tax=Henosepilachna vigintioctopunctata TaxID=420089 RepID=A0AAW1TVI9_9CUCU